MPVFRVNRNANYTTMSNYHLRDKSLSFKAKGLLSMFLSLPDSWHYSVNGIAAISKESRASVMSGLRELEAAGYLVRHQHRDSSGRMKDIEYFITEIPQKPPEYENSTADNPTAEVPTTVLPSEASKMCKTTVFAGKLELSGLLLHTIRTQDKMQYLCEDDEKFFMDEPHTRRKHREWTVGIYASLSEN